MFASVSDFENVERSELKDLEIPTIQWYFRPIITLDQCFIYIITRSRRIRLPFSAWMTRKFIFVTSCFESHMCCRWSWNIMSYFVCVFSQHYFDLFFFCCPIHVVSKYVGIFERMKTWNRNKICLCIEVIRCGPVVDNITFEL